MIGNTMDPRVDQLCANIKYKFNDPILLNQVLTRIQNVSTSEGAVKSFERLELLGDSVLNMVISDVLFRHFPNESRGVLTNMKAKLVCRKSLVNLSKVIGLPNFLESNEYSSDITNNMLENGVEALIGAIFIDGGFYKAKTFIESGFKNQVKNSNNIEGSSKTALNMWAQRNGKPKPEYSLDEMIGPKHDSKVKVSANLDGVGRVKAVARSRKEAEELAALKMLNKIEGDDL